MRYQEGAATLVAVLAGKNTADRHVTWFYKSDFPEFLGHEVLQNSEHPDPVEKVVISSALNGKTALRNQGTAPGFPEHKLNVCMLIFSGENADVGCGRVDMIVPRQKKSHERYLQAALQARQNSRSWE